jgi:hypothetical protein
MTADAARNEAMSAMLAEIDGILGRIERLAGELRADPDRYVRRSALELRAAFDDRRAIEPAVARMRESVRMLRRGNQDESRRECRRRATSLDYLDTVVEQELLPQLRRVGFDV